jgi:hypothetical protein
MALAGCQMRLLYILFCTNTAAAAAAAGCVPDLLVDNIITDGTPEPCSPNDPNAEHAQRTA